MEAKVVEKKEEVKEVKKGAEVVRVPTEYQDVFVVNGEAMSLNQYLVWMGNKLIGIAGATGEKI